MKKTNNSRVVFERTSENYTSDKLKGLQNITTKADIFRELTPQLLMANVPIRVVLVEGKSSEIRLNEPPETHSIVSDALFYRQVIDQLGKVGKKYGNQFAFKSFSGKCHIQKYFNLHEFMSLCSKHQFYDFFYLIGYFCSYQFSC